MSEHGGPQGPAQGRPAGGPPPGWQPPTGPQGWPQQGPGGNPQQPGAGNYGGPPSGPQGWQQPPTGPQGWQQPPTQTFPPQGPGGPGGPGQPWNPAGAEPPKKSKTPLIIALVVVVALVAAAGVWFFAFRDKNTSVAGGGDSGQSTPQASVTALFSTLSNSDPIGLADQLDPAEASLFTDLNTDIITELKRLEVLKSDASVDTLTGTKITVKDLGFAGEPEVINDHLQIVKLNSGTITVESNASDLPLSDSFKDTFGSELDQVQPQSQTVNIADEVAKNDGKPFRVATVQRDGQWYVSFFYTIADNATQAAGLPNPTAADAIAADGQKSPEEAVNYLVKAIQEGNLSNVIAITPPDEMGALHDYGQLILDQAGADSLGTDMQDLGFSIDNVVWDVSDVTGGKKVSIKSLDLTVDGQTASIVRDPANGTLTIDADGQIVELNDSTIETYIAQLDTSGELDAQGIEIVKREFKQIIGLGLVTTQVGGEWYVSPVRSFGDVFVSVLKGLEPGDIEYLATLAGN